MLHSGYQVATIVNKHFGGARVAGGYGVLSFGFRVYKLEF